MKTKTFKDLIKQRRFSKQDLQIVFRECKKAPEEYRLAPLLALAILDNRPLTGEEIRHCMGVAAKLGLEV